MKSLARLLRIAGILSAALGGAQLLSYDILNSAEIIPFMRRTEVAGGRVLGTLSISRLHLNLPILDNDDPASLAVSAGHIPGTSPLGSLGNAALAGHRDTTFRALRGVRLGDRIHISAGRDTTYVVNQIKIVDPTDTSLLREDGSPKLTLVTCYPFSFVGSAPLRFVIQAQMTTD